MQVQQKATSHKKVKIYNDKKYFLSPSPKNILQEQIQQLQHLSQQQLILKLKSKKQQILKQSQKLIYNCHQYFMQLTNIIIQTQNKMKKNIDRQTLNFLEQIQRRTEDIRENQNSYNCNSQIYQTLKMLLKNFTETQENISQVGKLLQKCYAVNLQGLNLQTSEVGMSTHKIYISNSEFITTNKKQYGNVLEITEREFQLALAKFQQREEKNMLLNERLKSKVKSLEEMLSKKGLNIKQLNRLTATNNQKCSQDYWDLELEKVKGQNAILTGQINNISNKLISLTSQDEALKGEYKRVLQLNMSLNSNQNNTVVHNYEGINPEQNSRWMTYNPQSQNSITGQTILSTNIRQARQLDETGIFLQHNPLNKTLLQYKQRTQQLSLQLSKKINQVQELQRQNSSQQKSQEELKRQNDYKQTQLQKLSQHCHTLQHDYEVSSKKKFQLEQKIVLLKRSLQELQERYQCARMESQLHRDSLQSMLRVKEQTIQALTESIRQQVKSQYESRLAQLKLSKEQLQKQINLCRGLLKQSQAQNELKLENFKSQFKRLQKTISQKEEQLCHMRQQVYQLNEESRQLKETKKQQDSPSWKQKHDTNKKQLSKLRKQHRQRTKQFQNIKSQSSKMNQLLGIRCPQMNNRIQALVRQNQKTKAFYEGKVRVLEQKARLMRQRFQFNMSELISTPQGQAKKANYYETIERYVQAMSNFCGKNAELKRLKEQNRQLKTNKSLTKLGRQTAKEPVGGYVQILQQYSLQIGLVQRALMEDRLRVQRGILQEKLATLDEENQLMKQKLSSKQVSFKEIQQQLNNVRRQVRKGQNQAKRQQNEQEMAGEKRSLQKKLQKAQSELRSCRNLAKRAQQEASAAHNQTKRKKDHISNMKKQLTSQQQKLQQLSSTLKNKTQQTQRLRRQLKDQSTKDTLVLQMKQRLEEYAKMDSINQQLKRQLEKLTCAHRFELAKLQTEIKDVRNDKKQEKNTKLQTKTNLLNHQLSDLKSKHKKLKAQLQRKETFNQHTKTKCQNQINQLQCDMQETQKQLQARMRQCEAYEKKLEIIHINQRKLRDRCRLLTVVVQKVYDKVLSQRECTYTKPIPNHSKQTTSSLLLQKTSPITKILNSNIFANSKSPVLIKQKDHPTLQTLNINLDDLQKYSEGLQMFGVNASQLKSLQTGLYDNVHNQTSTFSHFMGSPQTKNQTTQNNLYDTNKDFYSRTGISPNNLKQKTQRFSQLLSQNQEIDVGVIMKFFYQAIQQQAF